MDTRRFTAEQEAELLRQHESHFLDFKSAKIAPGKLQESIVAFANADGGELFIGVQDNALLPPKERIDGFANPEAANNHVSIADTLIDPALLNVSQEFISCPSRPEALILHLVVPKSPQVHYTSDKKCFQRKSAQNLALLGKAIERLIFSKGQRSYEDVPVETLRSKELAESEYMKNYLAQVPSAQPPEGSTSPL